MHKRYYEGFDWALPYGRIGLNALNCRGTGQFQDRGKLIAAFAQKLSADSIHVFEADAIRSVGPVDHVKLNIFPDGGVSRLRIFGRLA